MLRPGDQVPHFRGQRANGLPVAYTDLWQRRNLVLVWTHERDIAQSQNYVAQLQHVVDESTARGAECLTTADAIMGPDTTGLLVADRWGEIVFVASAADVAHLPAHDEVVDWIQYVQNRCPECEGESQ